MVYDLMIQKNGEEDVETVKLATREQWVLKQYVEDYCSGYC